MVGPYLYNTPGYKIFNRDLVTCGLVIFVDSKVIPAMMIA
jgi:hypothetical protein